MYINGENIRLTMHFPISFTEFSPKFPLKRINQNKAQV